VSDFRRLAMAAAVLGIAGCDDTSGTGDASVRVLLTDAPADYIASATVDIGAVELIGAEGAPIILTDDGTEGMVDLLELQDAATEVLAEADIDAGSYTQLRLVVDAASVTLADGYQFTDGTTERDLTVPSGAQTGIKLNLSDADAQAGIDIAAGETVLLLDFDVRQSFVLQGNPETPAGLTGILFQPTLRVVVEGLAGSISGSVGTALAAATVEGLQVTAERLDATTPEEFETATATAVTDGEGLYTLHVLLPGTYRVTVEAPEGFAVAPTETEVQVEASEDVIDVDFEVVAAG
jgi:hypothetical protein